MYLWYKTNALVDSLTTFVKYIIVIDEPCSLCYNE